MRYLLFLPLLISSPLLSTAQDTIYVSHQAKSYLLFNQPVTLADVGNPMLYQAQIEGSSILIVARQDSVADTPFYAVVGGEPFTARLIFDPTPRSFYDFRQRTGKAEVDQQAANVEIVSRLKELTSCHDLNFASQQENGIRFRLVGLVHDLSATYLKFKVENRTSQVYQTSFIGFDYLKRYKKGFWAKEQQAHFPLKPVADWQVNRVLPYSESYFYYALPIQPLERKEAIIATLREAKGSRSVTLKLPARLVRRADLY